MNISFYNYQTYDNLLRRVAYLVNIEGNKCAVYQAVCSHKDQFNYKEARRILNERKENNKAVFTFEIPITNVEILKDKVMKFIYKDKSIIIRKPRKRRYKSILNRIISWFSGK